MKMRMTTTQRAAVCGLLMGATAVVGFGQYQRSTGGVQQVQPQGNALDASPQVGSGGSNNPITGYVPINANNYVTGNVSGLGGFNQQQSVVNVNGVNVPVNNWNTGTQSPYTFRGDVGQNSSFSNWVRQSAGGLQTTPYSAANAYYSSSQIMSGAQGSIYASPYGSGFQSSLVPSYAVNPGASSGAYSGVVGGGLQIRQFSASPANVNSDAGDSSGLASPLFSGRVTGNALGVNPGLNAMNQNNVLNLSPNAGNGPNGQNNSNTGSDSADDQAQREKLAKPADLSSVARVNGQVTSGQRIQGQSDSVQNANVLPEGNMLAERSQVNDTYRTMMGELEKAQAKKKVEALAKATNKTGKPEKNGKGEAVATNTTGPGNTAMEQLATQQSSDNGVNGANGVGGNGKGKPLVNPFVQSQSTDPTKPGYRPKSMQAMRPVRIEDMTTSDLQAGKSVPEVKSFGPTTNATPTPFDELMKKAEGLLKDGKYLDAANAYQVAMLEEPNNPLAVMGRGNAELGAGMYESAAGDLKYIFSRRPELISVKYALEDYIPPQRQHQLIADLTDLSAGKGVGNTASFLLCYLDYNTGRNEELQRDLGRWDARPWKDDWLGIMKRALGNAGE